MTISFFLKKPPKQNGEHGIFAYSRIGREQMILYFPDLSVKPDHWSKKKQRVKPSVIQAAPMNDALDRIEADLKGIVATLTAERKEVTVDSVKSRFHALTVKDPTHSGEKSFLDYWETWLEQSERTKTAQTIKQHRSAKQQFEIFAEARGARLTFDRMDRETINAFVAYLLTVRNLQNSSIWQILKTWKTFMKWAFESGITTNDYFQKVKKKDFNVQEPPVVRLTEEEFHRLNEFDFSDSPSLDNARTLFILQCCLGVRVSDLLKIVADPTSYVEGDTIRVVAKKTRKEQVIPLNPLARRILFSDSPPHPVSDVKLNSYIKTAAKAAGIDRVVVKPEFRGMTRTDVQVPLNEEISSHCAKRTFVSLMIASGVHIQSIADITGNTLDTIRRYISLDAKEISREARKAEAIFR